MKKLITILLLMAFIVCPAMASLRQLQIQIVDEFGDPVTNITSINVFNSGLGTSPTIFADRGGNITVTNPITTSSTNSTFDQSLGLVRWFQQKPSYKITITDGSKTFTYDARNEGDNRVAWFEQYIGTAASLTVDDNQSITVGTNSDMVLAWNNSGNFMSWIPAADGSAFNLGTSGTGANVDFNVFVGTSLGLKLNEGAATLIIDGLTTSINTSSNFATNINTGSSTGAVTIGSSTSGTLALDTTAGMTINADDSILMTTSGGSADATVDALAGSVIIDGGEAVDDAVIIRSTGAAGGIDITSLGDIDITTTGTAGEDITIVNTGGSITITATEAVADAMTIGTSAAGGDLNLDSVLGRIEIEAEEDVAETVLIVADGGNNSSIKIHADTGTSVTEGSSAIEILADVGGIEIKSTANLAKAIQIITDSGTTETMFFQVDQGDGVASMQFVSDVGGITITATKPLKIEAALTLNDTQTIGDSDDTPDVSGFSLFKTGTVTDTIDDFDGTNIEEGQVLIVFSKAAITYDVTAGALICGTTDLITASGDVTFWVYDGTNWHLISWMDDAVDQNSRG